MVNNVVNNCGPYLLMELCSWSSSPLSSTFSLSLSLSFPTYLSSSIYVSTQNHSEAMSFCLILKRLKTAQLGSLYAFYFRILSEMSCFIYIYPCAYCCFLPAICHTKFLCRHTITKSDLLSLYISLPIQ